VVLPFTVPPSCGPVAPVSARSSGDPLLLALFAGGSSRERPLGARTSHYLLLLAAPPGGPRGGDACGVLS